MLEEGVSKEAKSAHVILEQPLIFYFPERGRKDRSQGGCCNSLGKIHHKHAEREVRGELVVTEHDEY